MGAGPWLKCMQYAWTGMHCTTLSCDSPAPYQYCQVFPDEGLWCPTTLSKMPKIVGMLPEVPRLTCPVPNLPHCQTYVTKSGPEKTVFVHIWPWPLTLDLDLQKKNQSFMFKTYHHAKYEGPRSRSYGSSFLRLWFTQIQLLMKYTSIRFSSKCRRSSKSAQNFVTG